VLGVGHTPLYYSKKTKKFRGFEDVISVKKPPYFDEIQIRFL